MCKTIKIILKGYILWIWYYLYKPYRNKRKFEAELRMNICKSCEYFNENLGICNICGCIMTVKTKMYFELDKDGMSIDGCLEKKW